jgi:two-component system chemotaxis response regulator CheB
MVVPDRHMESVVIGASAGGVEAVSQLLNALPADFEPTVLVVLHLPPEGPSALTSVFARKCARPVKEAEDKEPISPGTVYVAPADYHLLVEPDHSLSLSRDEARHYSRPSIDMLFESAALAYRDRVLAILLTGANSDGAEGMKQICECGGRTWVQDPAEAFSATMPEAAIRMITPERVMSLRAMAGCLSKLNRSPNEVRHK